MTPLRHLLSFELWSPEATSAPVVTRAERVEAELRLRRLRLGSPRGFSRHGGTCSRRFSPPLPSLRVPPRAQPPPQNPLALRDIRANKSTLLFPSSPPPLPSLSCARNTAAVAGRTRPFSVAPCAPSTPSAPKEAAASSQARCVTHVTQRPNAPGTDIGKVERGTRIPAVAGRACGGGLLPSATLLGSARASCPAWGAAPGSAIARADAAVRGRGVALPTLGSPGLPASPAAASRPPSPSRHSPRAAGGRS